MNIEVGKWYKNKWDRKCIVLEINPDFISIAFRRNDQWETNTLFHKDIISEWIDKPTIDRKVLPAWHKWAAMDSTGKWFSYIEKPYLIDNTAVWASKPTTMATEAHITIPPQYYPKWDGKPEDSLIELDNQTV